MKAKWIILLVACGCLIVGIIIGWFIHSSKSNDLKPNIFYKPKEEFDLDQFDLTTKYGRLMAKYKGGFSFEDIEFELQKRAIQMAKSAFSFAISKVKEDPSLSPITPDCTNEKLIKGILERWEGPLWIDGWKTYETDDGIYLVGFCARTGEKGDVVKFLMGCEVHLKEGIVRDIDKDTFFAKLKEKSKKIDYK